MYSSHAGMSRAGSPHDAASICLVIHLHYVYMYVRMYICTYVRFN